MAFPVNPTDDILYPPLFPQVDVLVPGYSNQFIYDPAVILDSFSKTTVVESNYHDILQSDILSSVSSPESLGLSAIPKQDMRSRKHLIAKQDKKKKLGSTAAILCHELHHFTQFAEISLAWHAFTKYNGRICVEDWGDMAAMSIAI